MKHYQEQTEDDGGPSKRMREDLATADEAEQQQDTTATSSSVTTICDRNTSSTLALQALQVVMNHMLLPKPYYEKESTSFINTLPVLYQEVVSTVKHTELEPEEWRTAATTDEMLIVTPQHIQEIKANAVRKMFETSLNVFLPRQWIMQEDLTPNHTLLMASEIDFFVPDAGPELYACEDVFSSLQAMMKAYCYPSMLVIQYQLITMMQDLQECYMNILHLVQSLIQQQIQQYLGKSNSIVVYGLSLCQRWLDRAKTMFEEKYFIPLLTLIYAFDRGLARRESDKDFYCLGCQTFKLLSAHIATITAERAAAADDDAAADISDPAITEPAITEPASTEPAITETVTTITTDTADGEDVANTAAIERVSSSREVLPVTTKNVLLFALDELRTLLTNALSIMTTGALHTVHYLSLHTMELQKNLNSVRLMRQLSYEQQTPPSREYDKAFKKQMNYMMSTIRKEGFTLDGPFPASYLPASNEGAYEPNIHLEQMWLMKHQVLSFDPLETKWKVTNGGRQIPIYPLPRDINRKEQELVRWRNALYKEISTHSLFRSQQEDDDDDSLMQAKALSLLNQFYEMKVEVLSYAHPCSVAMHDVENACYVIDQLLALTNALQLPVDAALLGGDEKLIEILREKKELAEMMLQLANNYRNRLRFHRPIRPLYASYVIPAVEGDATNNSRSGYDRFIAIYEMKEALEQKKMQLDNKIELCYS